MFNRKNILSVLLAAFFLAGCGGGSGGSGSSESFIDQNSDLAASVIENYVDDVVIDTYYDLRQKAIALREAVESIDVDNGTQADVQAAADAWVAARIPWEQSEAWLFGPVDFHGHDPALDSWPVNRTDLDAVLASSDELTEQYISALPPEEKGFHTVEYLLFREGETRNLSDFTSREIEYLVATAKDIESTAVELHEDWAEGAEPYGDVLKSAGQDGNTVYTSLLSGIEEIISGMSIILDEVANGKIADPYDEQDVELVESQFSFNSLEDFAHDIVGVLNAYKGCRVSDNLDLPAEDRTCEADGLDDLIAQSDSALAEAVETEINAAIDAILAISQPFRDAITDAGQADEIEAAQEAINDVFETLNGAVLTLVRQ